MLRTATVRAEHFDDSVNWCRRGPRPRRAGGGAALDRVSAVLADLGQRDPDDGAVGQLAIPPPV